MKIDAITLFHVKAAVPGALQTSRWVENDHECLLLRLHAGGLTAWGECVAGAEPAIPMRPPKPTGISWRIFLIPAVLGADLERVPAYHDLTEPVMGHNMAKAGLEMRCGICLPSRRRFRLQQALGGQGDRVRVGVFGRHSADGRIGCWRSWTAILPRAMRGSSSRSNPGVTWPRPPPCGAPTRTCCSRWTATRLYRIGDAAASGRDG